MFCINHPDIEATRSCVVCGKLLCSDCGTTDFVSESTVCGESCQSALPARAASHERFLAGSEHPYKLGWALWLRSLPDIALKAALPIAGATALFSAFFGDWFTPDGGNEIWAVLITVATGALAVALIGVILTQKYTAQDSPGATLILASRFLSWIATLAIVAILTITGYFFFVVPGIYIYLRLFWADEFALIHDANPLAAIRDSWNLSRGAVSEIFAFQTRLGFVQIAVWLPAMILLILLINLMDASQVSSAISNPVQLGFAAFVFVVAYAFSHACEIVFFYGLRADYHLYLAEESHTDADQPPVPRDPAARALSHAASSEDGTLRCPSCHFPYDPADYRTDAKVKRCSACGAEI